MRTDVKIGLICGLLVAGGGIAYFAWPTHTSNPGLSTSAPPIVSDSAAGLTIAGPATPATPTPATPASSADAHASPLGPTLAAATPAAPATPTLPAVALAPSAPSAAPGTTYPASFGGPVLTSGTVTPVAATSTPPGSAGGTLVLEPPTTAPTGTVPPTGPTIGGPGLGGPTTLTPPPTGLGGPTTLTPPPYNPTGPGYGTGTFGGPTTPMGTGLDNPTGTTGGTTYVVKAGDSFAKIAKAQLGNAKAATIKAIEQANPGVDSRHLKIGQKLNLPAAPTTGTPTDTTGTPVPTPTGTLTPATQPTTRRGTGHSHATGTTPNHALAGGTYIVKKGDDLHKIARTVYGDERRWKQIARANRDILADPNDLEPGMELKLPPQ